MKLVQYGIKVEPHFSDCSGSSIADKRFGNMEKVEFFSETN